MDTARNHLVKMLIPVVKRTITEAENSHDIFGMITLQGVETVRVLQRIQRKYELPDDAIIALYRECMLEVMINIVSKIPIEQLAYKAEENRAV